MRIEEMIALIDADLEASGNITDARIEQLHAVIDATPVAELLPKQESHAAQRLLQTANAIRAKARQKGMRGKQAENYFYTELEKQYYWGDVSKQA